jgi:TPR repeat protein
VDWYRKAADQGLPDAEGELGNCYLEGNGVPKDIPEGIKWTRRAATQGFAQAQNTLGLCYTKGTGARQFGYAGSAINPLPLRPFELQCALKATHGQKDFKRFPSGSGAPAFAALGGHPGVQ